MLGLRGVELEVKRWGVRVKRCGVRGEVVWS